MNGLGQGLAWMGFWLFLGAGCAGFSYKNGEEAKARKMVIIECIKAGREMGGEWYEPRYCLTKRSK